MSTEVDVMAGQPDDVTETEPTFLDPGIREAFAEVIAEVGRDLPSPHHATNSYVDLHELHGSYQVLYRAAGEALQAADAWWDAAESIARNDEIPPAARERRLEEARQKAEANVTGLADKAEAAAIVLERDLTAAALPPAPRTDREMIARDTVRMIADPVSPTDAIRRLQDIARGPDLEAAALATGTFGLAYLESRGIDPRQAREAHQGIVAAGLDAALHSLDPRRAKAARVLRAGVPGKLAAFARYAEHAVSTQKLPATVG